MAKSDIKMPLPKLDDLFTTEQERQDSSLLLFRASTKVPGLNGTIVVFAPDFSIRIAIEVTKQPKSSLPLI